MRDISTKLEIGWICTKCGTSNTYRMSRIDIDPCLDSVHRQPCCGCHEQFLVADLRIWHEALSKTKTK